MFQQNSNPNIHKIDNTESTSQYEIPVNSRSNT